MHRIIENVNLIQAIKIFISNITLPGRLSVLLRPIKRLQRLSRITEGILMVGRVRRAKQPKDIDKNTR